MVKAGRFDYPTKELDYCIDLLEKANEVSKEHVFTRQGFAEAIRLSPKGGNFASIVGAFSMYGLCETGDGRVRYTDLAKTIIHGDSSENEKGKSQAVRNVRLFAELYDKYDGHPTDEQIRLYLRDKGGVDISEVNNHTKMVSKIFNRLTSYVIPNAEKEKKSDIGGEDEKMDLEQPDRWILQSPYGSTIIKDGASFDAVEALLKVAKSQFKTKNESSVTDSKNDSNQLKGKKDSSETT